jgi:uncharacterized membrane protein (Fun14 family)
MYNDMYKIVLFMTGVMCIGFKMFISNGCIYVFNECLTTLYRKSYMCMIMMCVLLGIFLIELAHIE